jgi:hypothetical protein
LGNLPELPVYALVKLVALMTKDEIASELQSLIDLILVLDEPTGGDISGSVYHEGWQP